MSNGSVASAAEGSVPSAPSTTRPAVSISKAPWYLWPLMLSVDAPLVILAWRVYMDLAVLNPGSITQQTFGVWAVIFLAVWIGYLLDRWLDGVYRLKEAPTYRHEFYRRFRPQVVWLMGILTVVLTMIGLNYLTLEQQIAGYVLAAVSAVYVGLAYPLRRMLPAEWPRHFVICGLLVASVYYPFNVPWPDAMSFVAPGLMLWLYVTNCRTIYATEKMRDGAPVFPTLWPFLILAVTGLAVSLILPLFLTPDPLAGLRAYSGFAIGFAIHLALIPVALKITAEKWHALVNSLLIWCVLLALVFVG